MPKFMCPILIFSNAFCLSIKITYLIELWPLNLCLLFGMLPLGYSFLKLWYVPKYLVLVRQLHVLKPFGFFPIMFLDQKFFLRIIYIANYVCPHKIFFISCKFSGQSCAQSFWLCVNHPWCCLFPIVSLCLTLHWTSLPIFFSSFFIM